MAEFVQVRTCRGQNCTSYNLYFCVVQVITCTLFLYKIATGTQHVHKMHKIVERLDNETTSSRVGSNPLGTSGLI